MATISDLTLKIDKHNHATGDSSGRKGVFLGTASADRDNNPRRCRYELGHAKGNFEQGMRKEVKKLLAVLIAVTALSVILVTTASATNREADRANVVREWNEDGTAAPGTEIVGRSSLIRRDRGLKTIVHVRGLIPGGVYTFWWVVVQRDGTFPDDIFVAAGGAEVIGSNGRATVRMRALTGQSSIRGFTLPDGTELSFSSLDDPLAATVRVEIAYHGQVEDAGDDLPSWLSDFWTGSACPPDTPNPNPNQPHCPVYFAATHLP